MALSYLELPLRSLYSDCRMLHQLHELLEAGHLIQVIEHMAVYSCNIPYSVKATKENVKKPHFITKALRLSVIPSNSRLSSIGIPSKQVYIIIYIKTLRI